MRRMPATERINMPSFSFCFVIPSDLYTLTEYWPAAVRVTSKNASFAE